jgi:murein L,D-transpeptidase YcbB/YkuD
MRMKIRTLTVIAVTLIASAPADARKKQPALIAPMPAVEVALPSSPNALTVRSYYERRQYPAIWFGNRGGDEAIRELLVILRRAPFDGMASGPSVASEVEIKVQDARNTDDPMAIKAAEIALSAAWVDYVEAIRRPSSNVIYGDPRLAQSSPGPNTTLALAEVSPSLAGHLLSVSQVNPIYNKLREVAVAEASANGGRASDKVLLNLERSRILPGTGKYVFVNAAEQRLHMVEDGQDVDSMNVVVGNKDRYGLPTPIVAGTINYAVANPYWYVPPHLVRKFAPNIAKGPDAYFKAHGYEAIADASEHPAILAPKSINWKAVAAGTQSVFLRQRPNGQNSMGKMKFPFPNSEGIYLHDTPKREYFDTAKWPNRAQSNGCIRLEDYRRFAHWLFGRDVAASGDAPEQFLLLPRGVPVYVTYLTMVPSSTGITSFEDRYGWDRPGIVVAGMDVAVAAPLTTVSGQR